MTAFSIVVLVMVLAAVGDVTFVGGQVVLILDQYTNFKFKKGQILYSPNRKRSEGKRNQHYKLLRWKDINNDASDTCHCTTKTEVEKLKKSVAELNELVSKIKCNQKPNVYRNCSELQSMTGSKTNGEYKLHLNYPRCEKGVDVYCDGMDTSNPREYITLKAGEENNFSVRNYMGSPAQDGKTSTATKFSKIRILPDLSVVRDDFNFSRNTWSYNNETNVPFASGRDCSSWLCSTTKKGIFKMDLTGTGLRFASPISWVYHGYPVHCAGKQPIDYKIDNSNLVVSGNCGAYCGGCDAPDLALQIIGCEE